MLKIGMSFHPYLENNVVNKRILCLLLKILVLVSGCSTIHNIQDPQETATIETYQWGDLLEITFLRGPEIHTSEYVSFWIKNLSEYCMVFPYDFGTKIWIKSDSGWEEIDNIMHYSPEEDRLLDPSGSLFSNMDGSIAPDLTNYPINAKTEFKALLTGHFCDDESIVVEKEILFTVSP
jgi:hypothetical protein